MYILFGFWRFHLWKSCRLQRIIDARGAGAIIPKRREDLTCCRNGRGGVEQIRRPTQMTIAHPLDIYMYSDILCSVCYFWPRSSGEQQNIHMYNTIHTDVRPYL